jgi:hypothetical protein
VSEPTSEQTPWVETLRDDTGVPETVYLTRSASQTTDDGWLVTSLDVESRRPLAVGDRLIALDRDTPDEFLVEVVAVEDTDQVEIATLPRTFPAASWRSASGT